MHSSLLNSKVSKNIRNQGETLFCWAFAISTMIRQSLKLFVEKFLQKKNKRLEQTALGMNRAAGNKHIEQTALGMKRAALRHKIAHIKMCHDDVMTKLNNDDFHRKLRNELIMIPIPKILSTEYNENSPLSQGHYLNMAFERVSY